MRRLFPALASIGALFLLLSSGWPREPRSSKPMRIVFVSRRPAPDAARGAVPGLGPRHRALATGGRLMVSDGRQVSPLFDDPQHPAYFDVSDPSVSPDGRRIAFAATPHPDSGWRIQVHAADRGRSASVVIPPAATSARYDDLDPCWLDDSTLVFASTREGQRSQYRGEPVTEIYRFDFRGHSLARLTAERNGAEEPCVDPRTGRVVYTRWWFNRARPDDAAGDTINLWQMVSIAPDGTGPRVLASRAGDRRLTSLYQPAVARDGSIFGVVGDVLGLSPAPGAAEVTWRASATAPPRHVAGARFDPADAPRYGGTRGLASPSACSPAPLPDGRVLVSLDPGGRGDFGIWMMDRDGGKATPLVDLPGTLELDAVPWIARDSRRAPPAAFAIAPTPRNTEELARAPARFRYFNRDVFGGGFGAREAAAARAAGPVRIRFWAALPRPAEPRGDTLVLVREVPIGGNGRVDQQDLPAGVPMFEQLVDTRGSVLYSAHGAAHVAGYNAGLPGRTSTCTGCHRGHSTAR